MKRTTCAILVALAGWAAAPLAAAPLSLDDAMRMARASAAEVEAARGRSAAAAARAREAAAMRWPRLRLTETWIRTDSPADAFGLLLNQQRFSFPEFVASDPNRPDPLSTAMTRLEVEVPVYTGGELGARIEQARLAADAARHQAARAADQAAFDAARAWIDLAQAREAVIVARAADRTLAAHLDLARAYTAQGMLVRSDLLRAEVERARVADLALEAAGRERLALAMLTFRLGAPEDSPWEPSPLGDPRPLADLAAWREGAGGRADLEAARRMLMAGELEVKARRASGLPQVALSARQDWFDDRLFGAHGDSGSIAAMARLDLFDGGRRRAAVAAARAEAAAGRTELARFEQGVRLEVENAWETTRVALDRRATASAALAAAAESLRIVEERFRAGVVRSLDVLDAATAHREAEMRALVARAEAWRALLALAVASGRAPETILESTDSPSTEGPAS